jgi:anaerobic selenocysteine-containing dehydrogenase
MAMMNVIITEGLVDQEYVANYTVGYEELVERAKQYPPEKVAAITGIPAEDIRKLAREYGRPGPR